MSSRYEIIEPIGEGGVGSVYKALDNQLQREVAMKRVLTTGQGTAEEIQSAGEKLIAEAQTLSSLNHPNIITVFDVGNDEEGGFVVMELLKGETLDETVARGVLTVTDFSEVVLQTMEGLIAAQDKSVIHRDIKPTNIMLIWQASGKFQLKILDFGLAKFSRNPSVQTMDQDDAVMGSIFFMAPEQFERNELDERTDIYQMGCVYYNALTGQFPFNGETAPQVMNAHLQHKVVPIEQLRPDLPPAIAQWVMWLINRDIASRPANAKEALKFFPNETQEELPVAAPTPPVQVTTSIQVATPGGDAQAPPNLIVGGGSPTGPLRVATPAVQTNHTGAVTTRMQLGSVQSADVDAPVSKSKLPLILGLIGLLVLLGIGALFVIKQNASREREKRLTALHEADAPVGAAADVDLLVGFLTAAKSTKAQKSEASKALRKLQGVGVDEQMLSHLKQSSVPFYQRRLADILSSRNYGPAIETVLKYSKSATEDKHKMAYLNYARPLASAEHLPLFLEGLSSTKNLGLRKTYEQAILSIVRKSRDKSALLGTIRRRVLASKVDTERRSLFRVIGSIGEPDAAKMLEQVLKGKDVKMKQDAFAGYAAWPNRDLLPVIRNVIDNQGKQKSPTNKVFETAALVTYSQLAAKPGTQSVERHIKDWEFGVSTLAKRNGHNMISKMMQRTVDLPHPNTVEMLEKLKKDKKFGKHMVAPLGSIKKTLSQLPTVGPGAALKGAKAQIQGRRNAVVNQETGCLTGWSSSNTYFSWYFKMNQTGEYQVVVNQSDLNKRASEFVVFLNGKKLTGKSLQTASQDQYEPVTMVGYAPLNKGEVYRLALMAGGNSQPKMMDIESVVLQKK